MYRKSSNSLIKSLQVRVGNEATALISGVRLDINTACTVTNHDFNAFNFSCANVTGLSKIVTVQRVLIEHRQDQPYMYVNEMIIYTAVEAGGARGVFCARYVDMLPFNFYKAKKTKSEFRKINLKNLV